MFTEEELVELGAYTWEQIEALRGTDWYNLLMDPDAQIGASIYFGNGIADYTGPMGMGTFYLSDGKLFVGGDISLWDQDQDMYETGKGWGGPAQWGKLFEQADHKPGSYGLLPRLEGADYTTFNVGLALPGLLPPAGASVSVTKDKNKNWYLTFGLGAGEAVPMSFNLSQGFLADPEADVESFLKGYACNVNMGLGPGGGYTYNSPTKPGALEAGLYTPQFGGSCGWGFKVWPLR
jgi:hypothetical protein